MITNDNMRPVFGDQNWIEYNKVLKALERARARGSRSDIERAERALKGLEIKIKQ